MAGPAAIRPECASCTHAPASPYPARIACCRRGHDGERGRPDDTAFAVFQEAVTAPGQTERSPTGLMHFAAREDPWADEARGSGGKNPPAPPVFPGA